MRTRNVVLSIGLALSVASCGENPPPATTTNAGPALSSSKGVATWDPGTGTPVPQNSNSATPTPVMQSKVKAPAVPSSPIPPADAQWTIACDTVDGATHVAQAAVMKQRLIEETHMPDWYVVHGENKSDIFYGYYGDLTNKAEKQRADSDRHKIEGLVDRVGNPVVRGAILTPVSMPDPVAPSDWNLLNAPKDAYWTIEWATFLDRPDRKQCAVEMVRYYREHGVNNIYYYHGPQVSSVCIGAWKRDAVAEQGTGEDEKGHLRDDAHTQSADQALLVIPDIVPANMPTRVLEPGTNKPMAVEALKLEVRDPDMKAAMEKYHDHSVNGYQQGKNDANGRFMPNPSMLVQIPHGQSPTVTDENWRLAGGGQPPVAPQPRAQNGGDDVLRSIGGSR